MSETPDETVPVDPELPEGAPPDVEPVPPEEVPPAPEAPERIPNDPNMEPEEFGNPEIPAPTDTVEVPLEDSRADETSSLATDKYDYATGERIETSWTGETSEGAGYL